MQAPFLHENDQLVRATHELMRDRSSTPHAMVAIEVSAEDELRCAFRSSGIGINGVPDPPKTWTTLLLGLLPFISVADDYSVLRLIGSETISSGISRLQKFV